VSHKDPQRPRVETAANLVQVAIGVTNCSGIRTRGCPHVGTSSSDLSPPNPNLFLTYLRHDTKGKNKPLQRPNPRSSPFAGNKTQNQTTAQDRSDLHLPALLHGVGTKPTIAVGEETASTRFSVTTKTKSTLGLGDTGKHKQSDASELGG